MKFRSVKETNRDNAVGLFEAHTEEEQDRLMRTHCAQYRSDTVICYCHYYLEGLRIGVSRAYHIADLIFGNVDVMKNDVARVFRTAAPIDPRLRSLTPSQQSRCR